MKLSDITSPQTNVISIGYNTKGEKRITKSILVKNNDEFIALNGGIRIRITNIEDFYLDNKENRKLLKNQIS